MACCHGLTTLKGKIIGDPLDVIVFETTDFRIQDKEEEGFDRKYIFNHKKSYYHLNKITKDLIG